MQAERERLEIEAKLAIAVPKAEALDRTATADGSLCLTDAAKELQVRPKDLIVYLSSNQLIHRRASATNWIGYQDRIDRRAHRLRGSEAHPGSGSRDGERSGEAVRVAQWWAAGGVTGSWPATAAARADAETRLTRSQRRLQ